MTTESGNTPDTVATPIDPGKTAKKTEILSVDGGAPRSASEGAGRSEMPVSAVARMLGVATSTDLTLLDGKVDLLINKLSLIQARMDKVLATINGLASGADLERIDVQIGSLRTVIRESLAGVAGGAAETSRKSAAAKVESPAPPSPDQAAGAPDPSSN